MIEILICLFLLGFVIKLEKDVNKIREEFEEYKYEAANEIVDLIKEVHKLECRVDNIGIGFSDSIGLKKRFKQDNFDG